MSQCFDLKKKFNERKRTPRAYLILVDFATNSEIVDLYPTSPQRSPNQPTKLAIANPWAASEHPVSLPPSADSFPGVDLPRPSLAFFCSILNLLNFS